VATDKGQNYYENKLDEYRKRNVTQNNFVEFLRDINNTVSESDSAIEQLQIEKQRLEQDLKEIREEFGENELEDLRDKGPGRWNFDLYQLGRTKDDLIEKLEDLRDRNRVRGDLLDVKSRQVIPILEQLDAEEIRSKVYEQMNELTEKRIDNAEERINGRLENLEMKMDTTQEDLTRQIRDIREAARRERDQNANELLGFMDKVIDRLDGEGVPTQDLEEHKENLSHGEEVDSVDLEIDTDDTGLEGTKVDTGDDDDEEESKSKREKIEEALRSLGDDDCEFDSQGEIAEEFDVSDGRVSQIKSELN
jgi:hypothetical protein